MRFLAGLCAFVWDVACLLFYLYILHLLPGLPGF